MHYLRTSELSFDIIATFDILATFNRTTNSEISTYGKDVSALLLARYVRLAALFPESCVP